MIKDAYKQFKQMAQFLEMEEGIKYDSPKTLEEERAMVKLLLDNYCEAKDKNQELRKNMYISALMLRFWYVIKQLKSKCNLPNYDDEEYMDWLYEAIEYACKYRAWQKPEKKVNAQQAVRMCIETIRKQKLYVLSLKKNRDFVVMDSLDRQLDADSNATVLDTLGDPEQELIVTRMDGTSRAEELIQTCINKNKLVEAIILDTIAFNDTEKVHKRTEKKIDEDGEEYKQTYISTEFWDFKCLNILQNLPAEYLNYFCNRYDVNEFALNLALESLRKLSRAKLKKSLENTLTFGRTLFNN